MFGNGAAKITRFLNNTSQVMEFLLPSKEAFGP